MGRDFNGVERSDNVVKTQLMHEREKVDNFHQKLDAMGKGQRESEIYNLKTTEEKLNNKSVHFFTSPSVDAMGKGPASQVENSVPVEKPEPRDRNDNRKE